ncbi:acyltransferase domain-containing protein [Streptomyces durbertensis]|uniref:Acyltransferase domain-containing protein n=1 Tax=Streptomyces durbertensis TaxID=2448886 RepID=A0ABR6EBE3_9ACTN|nr:type I polyketide synthase [Streptomyces durbertensis]MBB1242650.1 acyltransferase domain-containing protein [Streptomyces durbertensis]
MNAPDRAVAIVGIDSRFPGARDREAFWRLLTTGEVTARPVPAARWRTGGDEPDGAQTPVSLIDDADAFDHRFFGVAPVEAAGMDPQQRLLLETAWRAVEDSGVSPASLAGGNTSVHVGVMSSEWANLHLADHRAMTTHRGSGNGYCMAANRLSYHLDLKGPSMAVDTACSSSLVAVQLACTGLRAGEVDTALVGGVNLILTPALSIFYRQAGLAAADGRCKPFAADADGIGRGEGVAVVVLRRLSDALADGQRVYAVIEGGAVGSDGRSNGLTAPNRFAQAEVVRTAYRQAGVDAGDLHFVEGHGTGTRLGDMIEVRALGDVHAGRSRPALLGSVKGNLGHLEGAAGIAGLVKTALALERRTLPGTPGGSENTELRLADHGFRLAGAATRLPRGRVLAGVSSFGLGGTNAHLVLSSPPDRPATRRAATGARPASGGRPEEEALLVTVSAATPDTLPANVVAMREAVAAENPRRTAQLAWSSTVVKDGLRQRATLAGLGRYGLLDACDEWLREAADSPRPPAATARRGRPRVALVFTGQGSQYAGMTAALLRHCAPYRRHLAEASAALGELGDGPHTTVERLLAGDSPADLDHTRYAQPALFAVEYALAATLLEVGLRPVAVLGHSVGEYAAAVAAGALELSDAADLVRARGQLMGELPRGGAMLAVEASEEAVAPIVAAAGRGRVLDIAAVNGPAAVTLSGHAEAVKRAAALLREAGHRARPLRVSHAFHSALMRPMVDRFAALAARVPPGEARVPLYSTVREEQPRKLDGDYWTEQICAPVRFDAAARRLAEAAPTHVVEVGPRPLLLRLLQARLGEHTALACSAGPRSTGGELAGVVAALHRDGADLDLSRWYGPEQRVRRPLPGYVFDRSSRFWWTAETAAAAPAAGPARPATPEATPEPVDGPDPMPTGPSAKPAEPAVPTAPPAAAVKPAEPAEPGERPAAGDGDLATLVRGAIHQVTGHDMAALEPHADLTELGFDSIMLMRLVDEIEQVVGPVDVEALLPRLTTVGELIDHLRQAHPAPEGVPS